MEVLGPTLCGVFEALEPDGAFELVCQGSGEYLFIAGTPWVRRPAKPNTLRHFMNFSIFSDCSC